jgi:transcriptional regulator with XRE-family HTH domain
MGRQKVGLTPQAAEALRTLGQQIQIARAQKNWSQSDLARAANVSRVTVSNAENGAANVSVGNVFNLAVVSGVRLFSADDPAEVMAMRRRGQEIIALLPKRVGRAQSRGTVDLDF